MSISRTYRYLAVVITALLLLLQGASLSHAASYGSDSHDHDGVECVLSLQYEVDAVVPMPAEILLQPALQNISAPIYETDFSDAPARLYRGREPPPRGPPSK